MTNSELRAAVVAKGKSREGKNQYTQGAKRTQVGSGYSDCSSFVRWCYLQVLRQDIGLNTAVQITNKKLVNVADVNDHGGKVPPEKLMLPGDLIYYRGTDPMRPRGCGHVEMYIGGGKIIGHGSGTGPTVKDMCTYSKSRASSGKGWLCVLRVITGDEPVVYPAKPEPQRPTAPAHGVRITGGLVNLRTGPGEGFRIVKTAKLGDMLVPVDTAGWRSILVDGVVLYVSEKLSEEV